LENNHEIIGINTVEAHKVNEPIHFLKLCEKAGKKLFEYENEMDIETIVLLAIEVGFNFHNDSGIILGYDLDCHRSKGCSGM